VAVGGFDLVLAADGEEPVGRGEGEEIDGLTDVGCDLVAESAEGVELVLGKRARFGGGGGDAGGEMREADGVGGFVALLPAWA